MLLLALETHGHLDISTPDAASSFVVARARRLHLSTMFPTSGFFISLTMWTGACDTGRWTVFPAPRV